MSAQLEQLTDIYILIVDARSLLAGVEVSADVARVKHLDGGLELEAIGGLTSIARTKLSEAAELTRAAIDAEMPGAAAIAR